MTKRQAEQVRRLTRLSTELAAGLAENQQRLHDHSQTADQQCAHLTEHLDQQSTEAIRQLEGEYNKQLSAARVRLEGQVEELQTKRSAKSHQLTQRRAAEVATALEDFEATDLRIRDRRVHDAEQLEKTHEQFEQKRLSYHRKLQDYQERIERLLDRRGVKLPASQVVVTTDDDSTWSSSLIRDYELHLLKLGDLLTTARGIRADRFLKEGWTVLLFLAVVGVGVVPWGMITGYSPIPWVAAVLSSSLLLAFVVYQLAHRAAASSFSDLAPEFADELVASDYAVRQAAGASKREKKAGLAELKRQCSDEATAASQQRQQLVEQAEAEFAGGTLELEQAFTEQTAELEQIWEQDTDKIRAHYRPLLDERRAYFGKQRQQALEQAAVSRDRAEHQYARERHELETRWQEAVHGFRQFNEAVISLCASVVSELEPTQQDSWQPPTEPPTALPLGHYDLTLPSQPGGSDTETTRVHVPTILSFPHDASLLLKATGEGRDTAIRVLQNASFRSITAFPAGKARLTIVDPLGLGQNFSAFMHLADYDDRLVSNRIWTEASHINQRLIDLTEHMENVIQKYLRNEFESIQEYNKHAGEVAEPFRILVVANYPHQFSDEAMRRLASIVSSGPRCGVYTLMSVDMSAKLPSDARWDDLHGNSQVFSWQNGGFVNEQEPFSDLPVTFDSPPDSKTLTRIIKRVGQHAQETRRVQVPFEKVAPAEGAMWEHECAEELTVPLGRSGATKSLSLKLGRGTAQHVLIAGKTGSGKSTLLHAIITNAALHYSPDEVQFYLIDFKKGVEFKPYADFRLPHARVIAIESEREFGLSVLHRLDTELRRRGDLFREAGVQTLAAFRGQEPSQPLPRLLLIVDEFQEFFVNDDKISHEASLLLDRLVRQGRAFGIHVILGSQTLAGSYSLARSTIGQMAVRIALECSAADAHLILSEDNSAARLLGRPGEAIYNDANGRLEGNDPFQIVWLPDAQRNDYLQRIRQRALDQERTDEPAIVFEGHATAMLPNNNDLQQLIEFGPSGDMRQPPKAWLGAPIEIKEPTSITFRRQSGANVLVLGQSRELANGLLASSLVSLVATHVRASARQFARQASFLVLDGEHVEQAHTDFADSLKSYLDAQLQIVGPAQVVQTIHQLSELLERRIESPDEPQPSVYLVIHDLARFRQLRPNDDEFGLGRFADSSATSTSGQLAQLLREGPALGIHTLVWADGYNTVSKWFDRATLREFGQRVLMQMSGVDSSHLMDSTAAGQLGAYRALLNDHDRGQSEKFRPYGMPDNTWMKDLQQRLQRPTVKPTNPDHRPDQGSAPSDAESLV